MDGETSKTPSFNKTVIDALISGTLSSTITTVIYQPLELLKTRIQLEGRSEKNGRVLGRLTRSALGVSKSGGVAQLWRGTGASLLRSGPGVGLYYALLSAMQSNLSGQHHKPDNATQAFCFGLSARSLVSFVLIPVTVVKVRYESGRFEYPSLSKAISNAYLNRHGWVGVAPTVIRDSLFSGTYYMCYTYLKNKTSISRNSHLTTSDDNEKQLILLRNFTCGLLSGLVASVATNPIDVVKTNIQAASSQQGAKSISTLGMVRSILAYGKSRFFDGLVPRSLRRTLIAATTWTLYELLIDKAR